MSSGVTPPGSSGPTPPSGSRGPTPPPSMVSPLVIGKSFVKQYYHILSNMPDQIGKFYTANSVLSQGEGSSPSTQVLLGETPRLYKDGASFELAQGAIDAQESVGGGILLVVTGHMIFESKKTPFCHTFFLNPIDAAAKKRQYYIHNDVLRFLHHSREASLPLLEETQPEKVMEVEESPKLNGGPAPKVNINATPDVVPPSPTLVEAPLINDSPKPEDNGNIGVEEQKVEAPEIVEEEQLGVEETKEEEEVEAEPVVEETEEKQQQKGGSPKSDVPKKENNNKRRSRSRGKKSRSSSPNDSKKSSSKPKPNSWASLVAGGGGPPPKSKPKDKSKENSKKQTVENTSPVTAANSTKDNNSGGVGGGGGGRAQSGRSTVKREPENTLVIKNISDSTKEADVRSVFEPLCEPTKAKIVGITVAGHRGLAFVDYDSPGPVALALEKQKTERWRLNGRNLDVEQKSLVKNRSRSYRSGSPKYRERKGRTGRGGRGGGR